MAACGSGAATNSGPVRWRSLRTVSRTSARIGVSIAVPHTSPSPWVAWPSPIENRAPAWKTGRNSVEPAIRWRVSMLPPCRSGGIVERGPVSGATPTSPQNGASGTLIPGQNSARSAPGVSRVILQLAVGEVVGQQPEAGDRRRPAPVRRLEVEQIDLERVARLGAVDGDRAVDLVDAVEVERRERRRRRIGSDLAIRGVEAVEFDDVTGAHTGHRRDGRIPRQVVLVARDLDARRRDRHGSHCVRPRKRMPTATMRGDGR